MTEQLSALDLHACHSKASCRNCKEAHVNSQQSVLKCVMRIGLAVVPVGYGGYMYYPIMMNYCKLEQLLPSLNKMVESEMEGMR